jgi:ribonuclease PH
MEGMEGVTVRVDCDVLQADGGTRTAAITGAWIALQDALTWAKEQNLVAEIPIIDQVAAISVGLVDGRILLDLEYVDDVAAEVDFNVVMTGRGLLVEVQGTAEGQPYTRIELEQILDMAEDGIRELVSIQKELVGE